MRVLCLPSLQPFTNIKEIKARESTLIKVKNNYISSLENLTIDEIYEDQISVLTAAHVLQALAASPRSALTRPAILCYYWIIREIYTADEPEWSVGGARAAPGGRVTACITRECVRALLDLKKALENTASLVDKLGRFHEHWQRLKEIESFTKEWAEADKERLTYASIITLNSNSAALVLDLELPGTFKDSVDTYFSDLPRKLESSASKVAADLEWAMTAINNFRKNEEEKDRINNKQSKNFIRSDVAHEIALQAVETGLKYFRAAQVSESEDRCKTIGGTLRLAAQGVRRVLTPTVNYLSSVLDHELVAASAAPESDWNQQEMVFAAAAYGQITEKWAVDNRLNRAVRHLSREISDRGTFRQ